MIPEVYLVRQALHHEVIGDQALATREVLARTNATAAVKPGDSVAIAVGSRGIHGINRIIPALVAHLKEAGANPFVFPAMGCHGGGSSQGQKATLAHLGITAEHIGCPVRSEIDPVPIGETCDGIPVYCDVHAVKADHLIVVNRIKPHSDFFGTIGSGVVKILVIGCGKMRGADTTHEAALTRGLEHMLRTGAAEFLKRMPVLGGLAILEGPTGRTAEISWSPADEMLAREPALFKRACDLAPAIPFHYADVLAIDWMGKNISGCGIDPFVIGRQEYLDVHDSYTSFRTGRIYVGDLTEESLGNADGIGMADATSQRLVSKLDYDAIRIGVMTSRTLPLGRIPIAFPSDRDAVTALLGTTHTPREQASLIHVLNTTDLEFLEISSHLLEQWQASGRGEVVAGPYALPFDSRGVMRPLDAAARDALGNQTQ